MEFQRSVHKSAEDFTSFSLGQPSQSMGKESVQDAASTRLFHIVLEMVLLKLSVYTSHLGTWLKCSF